MLLARLWLAVVAGTPSTPPFLSQPASAAALILCTYPDSDFAQYKIILPEGPPLFCFQTPQFNVLQWFACDVD